MPFGFEEATIFCQMWDLEQIMFQESDFGTNFPPESNVTNLCMIWTSLIKWQTLMTDTAQFENQTRIDQIRESFDNSFD